MLTWQLKVIRIFAEVKSDICYLYFHFKAFFCTLISAPCLTFNNCYILIWMTPYVRLNASPFFRVFCCSNEADNLRSLLLCMLSVALLLMVFPCWFKGAVLRNKQICHWAGVCVSVRKVGSGTWASEKHRHGRAPLTRRTFKFRACETCPVEWKQLAGSSSHSSKWQHLATWKWMNK